MWIVALCSYLFNRIIRSFVLILFGIKKIYFLKEGDKWLSGTRGMLDNPFGVLLPCIIGPRWNCHAMLAGLGPFRANEKISINTKDLQGAESWTFVVYNRRIRTIATSDSLKTVDQQDFAVSPDYYSIIFRYYGRHGDMFTPSVNVDGVKLAESVKFEGEYKLYNDLLTSIQSKRTVFYLFLQYYAFYLLKHENSFSSSLLRNQFLPVGNPETAFFYGYLYKGVSLKIRCKAELFENALVYVSIYNTASFPEHWEQIVEKEFSTNEVRQHGAYLIRVVPKQGFAVTEEETAKLIEISQTRGRV